MNSNPFWLPYLLLLFTTRIPLNEFVQSFIIYCIVVVDDNWIKELQNSICTVWKVIENIILFLQKRNGICYNRMELSYYSDNIFTFLSRLHVNHLSFLRYFSSELSFHTQPYYGGFSFRFRQLSVQNRHFYTPSLKRNMKKLDLIQQSSCTCKKQNAFKFLCYSLFLLTPMYSELCTRVRS